MAQSLSHSNSSISELSNKENVLDLSVEEVFQSFSSSSGAGSLAEEKVISLSSSLKASRPSSLSSFGDLVSSSHKVPSQEVKVKLPNGEEVVLGEWSGWSQSVARVPVRLHVSNLPFRYRLVGQSPAHQLHLAFCQGTQLGAALQQGRVRVGGRGHLQRPR